MDKPPRCLRCSNFEQGRKLVPLTADGQKVLAAMKKQYGNKKGRAVFYASINKGVKGSSRWHEKKESTKGENPMTKYLAGA